MEWSSKSINFQDWRFDQMQMFIAVALDYANLGIDKNNQHHSSINNENNSNQRSFKTRHQWYPNKCQIQQSHYILNSTGNQFQKVKIHTMLQQIQPLSLLAAKVNVWPHTLTVQHLEELRYEVKHLCKCSSKITFRIEISQS